MRVLFIHIIAFFCLVFFSSDTIAAGSDNQQDGSQGSLTITVNDGGSFRITAEERIVFGPGTKVTAGGSLKASISGTDIASLKQKEQERPLEVTTAEQKKLDEHSRLETAYELFRPFSPATFKTRVYREEKQGEESIDLSSHKSKGIASEQQRRIVAELLLPLEITTIQLTSNISPYRTTYGHVLSAVMVLRL